MVQSSLQLGRGPNKYDLVKNAGPAGTLLRSNPAALDSGNNDLAEVTQVDTLDLTGVTANSVILSFVTGPGSPEVITQAFTTDIATTLAALRAQIVDASSIFALFSSVAISGNTLVFTGRLGEGSFSISSTGEGTLATTTAATPAPFIPAGRAIVRGGTDGRSVQLANSAAIAGVTYFQAGTTESSITNQALGFERGDAVNYTRGGKIVIELEAAITAQQTAIFVRTTAAGELDKVGAFTTVDDGNTVPWPGGARVDPSYVDAYGNIVAVADLQAVA